MDDTLYIIQKEAAGPLNRWMDHIQMTEEILLRILNHTAQALNFLHSNGIIHGDVKASNILVFERKNGLADEEEQIFKLADFNLTTFGQWKSDIPVCTASYRPIEAWNSSQITNTAASESAAAAVATKEPHKESTKGSSWDFVTAESRWNEKVDIWGLGCALYFAKYGTPLFKSQTRPKYNYNNTRSCNRYREVVSGKYLRALYDWEREWYARTNKKAVPSRHLIELKYKAPMIESSLFSSKGELDKLMVKMLCPYPKGRPSTKTILSLDFVSQVGEKVYGKFNRLTPLRADKFARKPKIVRKSSDVSEYIAIVDNKSETAKSLFLHGYTKDEVVASLASRIYTRFLKENGNNPDGEDLHYVKTAIVWMAAKMAQRSRWCERLPSSLLRTVNMRKICRIERDISRKLNFILH
jgi:serine/threonine protein kinase